MSSSPSLTIVLFGRNDDYNGNYKYRLFTCLKFLEKSIIKNKLQKRVHINFIDWNSDKPFSKEKIFPKKILKNINLYTLSPEVLKKNGFIERFNIQLCCNYGVRRAKDDYILYTNTDILISEHFLKNLFNLIDDYRKHSIKFDKNSLLIIPRKFIPPYVTETELDSDDLEKYIYHSSRFFKEAGKISGVCAGLGGIFGEKKIWHKLQGFKEDEMRGHGWNDVELGINALKKGKLIDLDFFGLYLYDLQQSQILKKNINTNKYQLRKQPNLNWGLSTLNVDPINPSLFCNNIKSKKNNSILSNKISFFEIFKALIFSSITNYQYAILILKLILIRKEKIINFFIKTDDFRVIEFLYYLCSHSFINYFMSSEASKSFSQKYLRFHYRLIKNPRKNIFKPYIDTNFNEKFINKSLILFNNSIPNVFINLKPNKLIHKNNFYYKRKKNLKFNTMNNLLFAVCFVNYINTFIQKLYYQIKKIIKLALK